MKLVGQGDVSGILTASIKLAKDHSYLLACFTVWKETKKRRPVFPLLMSCQGTQSNIGDQLLRFLSPPFTLGAWNQNKSICNRDEQI